MSAKPLPIGDFLQKNPVIQQLLKQRQHDAELFAMVRGLLPAAMQTHCVEVRVSGSRLTLYLDSPAWLTRLRFVTADIAAAMAVHQISEVCGRIRLDDSASPQLRSATRPKPCITATAAAHLRNAAAAVDDPELSALFMRLASRHVAATTAPAD